LPKLTAKNQILNYTPFLVIFAPPESEPVNVTEIPAAAPVPVVIAVKPLASVST